MTASSSPGTYPLWELQESGGGELGCWLTTGQQPEDVGSGWRCDSDSCAENRTGNGKRKKRLPWLESGGWEMGQGPHASWAGCCLPRCVIMGQEGLSVGSRETEAEKDHPGGLEG